MMEMENEILNFLLENYGVAFLYGLKLLNDISKSHVNLEKIVAVHEAEIENLKKVRA